MRFSELFVVPLLVATTDALACKAKRPDSSAVFGSTAVDSASGVPTLVSPTASAETTTASSIEAVTSTAAAATSTTATSSDHIPTTAVPTSVSAAPTSTAAPTTLSTATVSSASTATTSTAEATSAPTKPAPTAEPYRAYPADVVDKLRDSSIPKLESYQKRAASGSCTLENASIRREWSDLSIGEREAYIAAVQCLQKLPAKTSTSVAPGVRSRFDDFVAVHIQQTPNIHNTANFLSWHRYYIWQYEKALRDECGYTGFQPYWNWNREVADPTRSAIFNGNATSLGGNSPSKGACVNSGPFKDMSVNLGPGSNLKYNPRCLKRDISASEAKACTADKTYSLITNSKTISNFQNTMQGIPGVHAGGHFTIGGDPGSDIHSSSGDPAFYLHHCMIDRVWWLWQLQDLETRLTAVGGNTGSRPGTVNDDLNLGVVAGSVKLGDLLNTMGGKGGEFCYIYV